MKEKGKFLKKYRGTKCLNCNVPLDTTDKYCHQCGQINSTKKISFKDFFSEFFSSIFSYDSRLRHTITSLLFKPGKISKEYIAGKRIKYANPFRFYLSVSIVFFILNSLIVDTEGFFQEFNMKSDNYKKNTQSTTTTDDYIKSSEKTIVNYSETQLDSMNYYTATRKRWKIYRDYYNSSNVTSSNIALKNLGHNKTWYTKNLYKRATKLSNIKDGNNIPDLINFIINKLPFIIFLFLPVLALGIWLLYFRKPFNYMEHLTFTFHTQTMFFLLFGFSILIGVITNSNPPSKIAFFIFLFYLYRSMRTFYQQNRGKTIVKFLLVNVLFFILAGIGSIITIISSIFIY